MIIYILHIIYHTFFGSYKHKYKNPEEMNDFIKNLMDPFNNSVASVEHDFDSYYDEYYDLYGIKKDNDTDDHLREFKLKQIFSPTTYFNLK
jgi:hypothetical protein